MLKDISYGLQQKRETDQRGISGVEKRKRSFIPARDLFYPSAKRANHGDLDRSLSSSDHLGKRTVFPRNLKMAAEHLFPGLLLDDARVHYNSDKPAKIGKLAYTEGKDIYFAQDKKDVEKGIFDHEMGHLIQQSLRQVKATGSLRGMSVNTDRRKEEEADVIGKAIRKVSEDPTRSSQALIALSRTELFSRYHENVKRLDQLKTPSKDVIQMYPNPERYYVEGDFNIQDSPAAEALDTVMSSLPRDAASSLEYCCDDRYDDDSPRTYLQFRSRSINGAAAETEYYAVIEGHLHSLDNICNPQHPNYHLGLQLNRDTPIAIIISVDTTRHGAPLTKTRIMGPVAHEITGHAINAVPWLQDLRSSMYTSAQIRDFWRISNQSNALLDVEEEHRILARGDNRPFNETVQNVYRDHLASEEERLLFQQDIRNQMDDLYNEPSGTPRYPI